ncbi:uncharacterized protein LOC141904685 [Tubulanus polymorphus]|uniref:uncharacterized protein LOC141904685 n=1 Tax=Tubulanus polymorphus TaxID=672921 RepID=UPI003DA53693
MDLHEAAFCGDLSALRKLIESFGECLDERNRFGHTPLHKAAMNGQLACVIYLVEGGADVNSTDISGCTPLHHAAGNGYVAICKYLLEIGNANMNTKSNKGFSVFTFAKLRGRKDVCTYLQESGLLTSEMCT